MPAQLELEGTRKPIVLRLSFIKRFWYIFSCFQDKGIITWGYFFLSEIPHYQHKRS